jgi:hypothetical protein
MQTSNLRSFQCYWTLFSAVNRWRTKIVEKCERAV